MQLSGSRPARSPTGELGHVPDACNIAMHLVSVVWSLAEGAGDNEPPEMSKHTYESHVDI